MAPKTDQNDVLIRNTTNEEFEFLDVHTLEHVAGPYGSFAVAIAVARRSTAGSLFYQRLDHNGRAMGEPRPIRLRSVTAGRLTGTPAHHEEQDRGTDKSYRWPMPVSIRSGLPDLLIRTATDNRGCVNLPR